MELRFGMATDVGRLRAVNEDSILALAPLFAVADGMGGHAAGEVASQVALSTVQERFVDADTHTTESLVQAVQAANRAIHDRSVADLHLRGMGTTLTGVAVVERDDGERLAVVNVGDSRTYVVQDGILQQITRDHTYVEDLVAAGEITADEARFHPRRHIITRALGIDPDVQVDAWEAPAAAGDRYLVCSDGLFNEVDDGQIAAVLTGTEDPQYAADTLVELANAAGGRDNISVIVVDVIATPEPSAPPVPTAVEDHEDHEPPATVDGADVVETPVVLASPDGSPAVGGWVDPDAAPTDTTPVPLPVRPPDLPPPAMAEPKRRRVTWRSALFVVAILAILGIAFGAITYYGRSGYYVGFVGDQVAVFKGQKGGVLWVKPTLDGTYDLHRADLTPAWQQRLDDTITFTSRASADAWFETLRANPAAVPGVATSATVTLAPTTAPATTAPPSTDLTPTTAAGP
jgi:serine/threonine protein phosphatase PrpC